MKKITDRVLRDYAKKHLNPGTLYTLDKRKEFGVTVVGDDIIFTPSGGNRVPRGEEQSDSMRIFCNDFNRKCSFKPSEYPYSFRKSYLLALIAKYIGSLADGSAG